MNFSLEKYFSHANLIAFCKKKLPPFIIQLKILLKM